MKAFSHNLSEEELRDFKNMIAHFFAERAIHIADQVWEEKGWTDEDVDRMLNTKMELNSNEG
ncbi:MAG: hypothetical protein WA958_20800 [Tunicatimonas sp.]